MSYSNEGMLLFYLIVAVMILILSVIGLMIRQDKMEDERIQRRSS